MLRFSLYTGEEREPARATLARNVETFRRVTSSVEQVRPTARQSRENVSPPAAPDNNESSLPPGRVDPALTVRFIIRLQLSTSA